MLLNESTAVPVRKGPPRPQDAIAPIPAAANSYDMTTEDDIGDVLTLLAASGEAISMYAAGSREAILESWQQDAQRLPALGRERWIASEDQSCVLACGFEQSTVLFMIGDLETRQAALTRT